jgi:hypothetical protein
VDYTKFLQVLKDEILRKAADSCKGGCVSPLAGLACRNQCAACLLLGAEVLTRPSSCGIVQQQGRHISLCLQTLEDAQIKATV